MTTWTPAATATGAWTIEAQQIIHTFSPYVFSRLPVFDTGTTQGVWNKASAPATSWAAE